MSCHFYGKSHVALMAGRFMGQGGNECALISDRFAPCQMEINGQEPRWMQCALNPIINSPWWPRKTDQAQTADRPQLPPTDPEEKRS